jgi:hypothetical protein
MRWLLLLVLAGTALAQTTLSGAVDGWSGGAATLRAHSIDDQGRPVLIAEGTLSPEGTFALELPDPPAALLVLPPEALYCQSEAFTAAAHRVAGFGDLEVWQDGARVGTLMRTEARPDPALAQRRGLFLYVEADLAVSEVCLPVGLMALELTLTAGWNRALVSPFGPLELGGLRIESGDFPASLPWFYVAHAEGR